MLGARWMKRAGAAALPVLVLASLALAGAPAPRPETGGPHTPEHQMASLGRFQFESGESIDDLKVSYVTYGKLNAARDNAVLSLQHFLGDHHDNEFLTGPGKALDPDKYFIIATDFLGNAKLRQDLTTGPTNSGLKMHFPSITARDWVNADYKLVKEYLGIDHVAAVIGFSIGGINTFQFGVSHPDFASAIIPMGASPHTNPQARLVLRHAREVIALDPGWYGGMYDVNPVTGLEVALMGLVPWYVSTQRYMETLTTTNEILNYERFMRGLFSSGIDARDAYYQLRGWSEFNLADTPGLNGDLKAALASVKAKTLLIGVKEDLLSRRDELQFAKDAISNSAYVEFSSSFGHVAFVGGLDRKFDEMANSEIAKFLGTIK
jgi:homoserine O-acetyltransferase/O-succinyltransferase